MSEFFEYSVALAGFIPLLPLIGAAINGLYAFSGARPVHGFIHWVACGSIAISFILTLGILGHLLGLPENERSITVLFWPWIHIGSLQSNVAFLLDPLSVTMMLVVSGVGSLIHVYSIGYMHDDPGYARYFSYLNLFSFAMLVLVMADNLILMFVGWEGVGLCSYLLIGFWFTDKAKAVAGMKAFVVNRIGDFAFIVGLFILFWTLDGLGHATVTFTELTAVAPVLDGVNWYGVSAVGIATLLFFIGATGKSAQIPLYVWLPDAMAGPTPVSALIHAATMVTAGVYLIGRLSALFVLAPETLALVAAVGFLTALYAGTIAVVQKDIKKVLAYSTISQLGFMFGAMGVMAFVGGIFHLVTHSFFKALLFLGAGSVIHAMSGEQDMSKMGGLKSKLPVTYKTFLLGTLAIAGIFPFAGFVSKDEILWNAFDHEPVLWVIGISAALLTAFYMFRLLSMTFFGKNRSSEEVQSHIHESPSTMTIPLISLAILSVFGGLLGVPEALGQLFGLHGSHMLSNWLAPSLALPPAEHHAIPVAEYILMILSLGIAVGGCYLGFVIYTRRQDIPEKLAQRFPRLYQAVFNKYYVDEAYQSTFVAGTLKLARFLAVFDQKVIDGMVNLAAFATKILSWICGWFDNLFVDGIVNRIADACSISGAKLRLIQTGKLQNYVYVMVTGVVVVMFWRLLG